jgi:hypothetical protein
VTTPRPRIRAGRRAGAAGLGLLAALLPLVAPGAAAATTPPAAPTPATPATPASPGPATTGGTTPAAAATARTQILLTGVTPSAVEPRDPLVVTGRITNRGTAALPATRVTLRLNPANLKTRAAVRAWTSRGSLTDTRRLRGGASVPALAPGASATFSVTVPPGALDLPGGPNWGPRGLAIEALAGQTRVGLTRTTFVWFPRKEFDATQLTLLAPVTAPRGTDVSAPSEELTASFAPGGTLSRILEATRDPLIGWALDPAVLQAAGAVAGEGGDAGSPGTTAGTPATGGSTPTPSPSATTDPALRSAAAGWLTHVRAGRQARDVVTLPFGDPDLVAVNRAGAGPMLRNADRRTRTVTKDVFGIALAPQIAWPAGGEVDAATLAALESAGRSAVILGSRTQPLVKPDDVTPTGRSTVVAGGGTLDGLLYDEQLSALFGATGGSRGAAATQQLVSELAAVTWELPSESRHLLAVVPRGWDPDPRGVHAAMTALRTTPWISLRTLQDLRATAPPAARVPPRYSPAATAAELPPAHVTTMFQLYRDTARFGPALLDPEPVVDPILVRCLMLVSAAWRRDRLDLGAARSPVAREVHDLVGGVHIVRGSSRPYFLASEASLPVYVANGTPYPVQVVVTLRPKSGGLVIDRPVEVQLDPNTRRQQVLVPTRALASGDVQIAASVRTPGGQVIGSERDLVIRVRREWETRGIIGVGTLLALLLAVGLLRGVRRDRTRVRPEDVPDVDDLASAAGDRAAARRDAIEEAARDEGGATTVPATDSDETDPGDGSAPEGGSGRAVPSPDSAAGDVAVDVGDARDRPVMSREHR